MVRILSAVAAGLLVVLAAMTLASQPAQAYGDAPWCAVLNTGMGEVQWDCTYDSIEACRPNVLGGNRGFCNPNPAYHGPAERAAPRHHRSRRH